ncbi:hypothetical protein BSM4216_3814 [Bacillus smithii]|nr:hypothetical protein BSM4216_3814 [Bacillus smithii]
MESFTLLTPSLKTFCKDALQKLQKRKKPRYIEMKTRLNLPISLY